MNENKLINNNLKNFENGEIFVRAKKVTINFLTFNLITFLLHLRELLESITIIPILKIIKHLLRELTV